MILPGAGKSRPSPSPGASRLPLPRTAGEGEDGPPTAIANVNFNLPRAANWNISHHDRASDLPVAWDSATSGNPFLKREILSILEQANPCGQRYHIVVDSAGGAPAIAVSYRQRLNLLTFSRGTLRWPVRIVGVPCSVAAPGIVSGSPATAAGLLDFLRGQRGLTLVLNTPTPQLGQGFVSGHTLPCCRLRVRWPDFAAYLNGMRSHYRHAVQSALKSGAALVPEKLASPAAFDDSLHALYLNVFRRSPYPLECLTPAFFREFPADITVFRVNGRAAGFVQTMRHADTLIFMFGGVADDLRPRYDTYLNMLLHIVRTGIETGANCVDLGQTAEIIKLKLGCEIESRHMHATHSLPAMRWLLRRSAGLLSHRNPEERHRVFRA